METCLEESCQNPVYARRLCATHYQKARVAGTLPPSVAVEKACASCGRPMVDRTNARAKFCSPACKEAARTAARRQEHAAKFKDRRCRQCGGPIDSAKPAQAVFCSTACLVTFQNQKRVEKVRVANLARRLPCRRCGAEIPDDKRSHAVYCSRECMTLDVRARNYDSEKARDYNRRYNYGIKLAEFEVLLISQGGGCAICGTTDWPGKHKKPHVDHCHRTNKIRGILCDQCNNGLGRFRDDPALLRAAADYVEAHQT